MANKFLKSLIIGLPYDPAVPLLPTQEKTCLHKPCTHMFIALFIKPRMEATQLSIKWWIIIKRWYIHTVEYYITMKRHRPLIHATTWMNSGKHYAEERSQTQKITCYMIPFIRNIQNGQIYRNRKMSGSLGLGRGWELKGTGFLLKAMNMFQNCSDGCTYQWLRWKPLNCTL